MTSENFHLPFLLKPALSHITRLMSHNMKPYICWDVGCELEVSWILNAFEAWKLGSSDLFGAWFSAWCRWLIVKLQADYPILLRCCWFFGQINFLFHRSFFHPLICSLRFMQTSSFLPSYMLKPDQGAAGSAGVKSLRALAFLGVGVSGLLSFATIASADEAEHGLACPSYPWPHKGILSSYDHASWVIYRLCIYQKIILKTWNS